eukprot:6187219-Pleurochrysis_carterae.AAC.1
MLPTLFLLLHFRFSSLAVLPATTPPLATSVPPNLPVFLQIVENAHFPPPLPCRVLGEPEIAISRWRSRPRDARISAPGFVADGEGELDVHAARPRKAPGEAALHNGASQS